VGNKRRRSEEEQSSGSNRKMGKRAKARLAQKQAEARDAANKTKRQGRRRYEEAMDKSLRRK